MMATILKFRSDRMGRKKTTDPLAEPTPEQMRSGAFVIGDIVDKQPGGKFMSIGKAYRRRPMIDVLFAAGVFDEHEYKALRHYRHHADLADRSPIRDSLGKRQGGGSGDGPTITTLNAIRIVSDCEKAAGSLVDILRAVVVNDWSLSQWAMEHAGAIEKCRQKLVRGQTFRVCRLEPRDYALRAARQEIKLAAQRVMNELDA